MDGKACHKTFFTWLYDVVFLGEHYCEVDHLDIILIQVFRRSIWMFYNKFELSIVSISPTEHLSVARITIGAWRTTESSWIKV